MPFFSAASGTPSRSNDRPVNTPQIFIDTISVNDLSQQRLFDLVQWAIGIPFVEVLVNCLPRTELFRKVAPRSSSS